MGEIFAYFKNKKNLVNLLILSILVLGIPLGVNLVRLQQIIKSRAAVDPIVFTGPNVRQKNDGSWVALKPQIQIQLTSPLGPPGTPSPSGTPAPTPTGTPRPTPTPSGTPRSTPTPTPSSTPTACSATAPTGLSTTALLPNSATLKWTPGKGSTRQLLRVAATKQGVTTGCVSAPCIIKVDNLTPTTNSYNTEGILSPGTTYWWRVVTWGSASCWKDAVSSFTTPQPLVSLNISPLSGPVGTKVTFTANLKTTKTPKSSQGYQWWDRHTGNGIYTNGPTYIHAYTAAGTYVNPAVRVYFTDGTMTQVYGDTISIK